MSDQGYFDIMKDAIAENQEIVRQNKAEAAERKALQDDGVSAWDKIRSWQPLSVLHYSGGSDDNIEMLDGTTTLLGDDFKSLYEKTKIAQVQAQNDAGETSSVGVIQADCSYPTEMHYGGLQKVSWTNYDDLTPSEKAAYEVTLLTKKYAAMPDTDEVAQEYAGIMNQYKQYCDQNSISWANVIQTSSYEFQMEVSDYMVSDANKNNIVDQVSKDSAKSKAQAADGHNLLLTCAPEGYQDAPVAGMDASVTYEDTCDSTYDGSALNHTAGFFVAVHAWFETICDKMPFHPIEWAKSVFESVKDESLAFADTTKSLMDNFDEQSDARMQERAEIAEQVSGIEDDISETPVGEAAGSANDAIADEVQQIFEDPSQEIQDGRDWVDEKIDQARPYVDAAGNVINATGEKAKERVDEFVDKWATPEENSDEYEDYQP